MSNHFSFYKMIQKIINPKFLLVIFLFIITNNMIYSQWVPAKGPFGGYVYSFQHNFNELNNFSIFNIVNGHTE